jgi:kinesin family protein 3/17
MLTEMDHNRENIRVCVRIRPINEKEIRENATLAVRVDNNLPNTIVLDSKPEAKLFTFDWVCNTDSTQEEIFNRIGKEMVNICLEGKNHICPSEFEKIFRLQQYDFRLRPDWGG